MYTYESNRMTVTFTRELKTADRDDVPLPEGNTIIPLIWSISTSGGTPREIFKHTQKGSLNVMLDKGRGAYGFPRTRSPSCSPTILPTFSPTISRPPTTFAERIIPELGPLGQPGYDRFYAIHDKRGDHMVMGLSWTIDQDRNVLRMAMKAQNLGYISIGFTKEEGLMIGSDSIIGGMKETGVPEVNAYKLVSLAASEIWNNKKPPGWLLSSSVKEENTFLTVEFERQLGEEGPDDIPIDTRDNVDMIWATKSGTFAHI